MDCLYYEDMFYNYLTPSNPYLQMFSFATGYFHLLCFSFHKWHKMSLLQLRPLFLPFVFYENALYLCIEK